MPSQTKPTSQPLGRVRLSQLPQPYREAFQSGTIGRKKGLFAQFRPTPQPHLWGMLIGGAVYALLLFPLLWGEFAGDLGRDPRLTQLILISLLALLGLALALVVLAIYRLWTMSAIRRDQAHNFHSYGLLLDSQNLVARLPTSAGKSCYFIPRDHIQAMRFHRPSQRDGQVVLPSRLELAYVDHLGKPHTDILKLGDYDDNELEAMAMRYTQRLKAG